MIIFNEKTMLDLAAQNPYPRVGKDICGAQLLRVWQAVYQQIHEEFCKGRGVRIPGLLTITYKLHKQEISHNNVVVNRIPVLLIWEDLCKKYFITSKRPPFSLTLPETVLNMSAIAVCTGLPRNIVEICISEVVQAFHRALVRDNHVEFHLTGIGRLVVECRNSYATFCTDFMNKFEFERPRMKHPACAF